MCNWKRFVFVSGVLLFTFLNSGCATFSSFQAYQQKLNSLAPQVKQAIVVQSSKMNTFKVRLSTWQKEGNQWRRVFSFVPAVIGRNGFAKIGEKKEGDGKTPSGVYALGPAFGYLPIIKTKLDYQPVTESDFWVDDPDSSQYNQWVVGKPNAKSYEVLKRQDDLYKYGVVIGYNTNPIEFGKGSAIFLHVWRGSTKPTAGCVAISEADLITVLGWLDRAQNPVINLNNN